MFIDLPQDLGQAGWERALWADHRPVVYPEMDLARTDTTCRSHGIYSAHSKLRV